MIPTTPNKLEMPTVVMIASLEDPPVGAGAPEPVLDPPAEEGEVPVLAALLEVDELVAFVQLMFDGIVKLLLRITSAHW